MRIRLLVYFRKLLRNFFCDGAPVLVDSALSTAGHFNSAHFDSSISARFLTVPFLTVPQLLLYESFISGLQYIIIVYIAHYSTTSCFCTVLYQYSDFVCFLSPLEPF